MLVQNYLEQVDLSERTVHMHKFHDFRVPANCVLSSILCQMCQFNQVLCNVKMLERFLNEVTHILIQRIIT